MIVTHPKEQTAARVQALGRLEVSSEVFHSFSGQDPQACGTYSGECMDCCTTGDCSVVGKTTIGSHCTK